jgi:DNA recombination-dependent growth factor C
MTLIRNAAADVVKQRRQAKPMKVQASQTQGLMRQIKQALSVDPHLPLVTVLPKAFSHPSQRGRLQAGVIFHPSRRIDARIGSCAARHRQQTIVPLPEPAINSLPCFAIALNAR